ncbi:MAG TPA: hypothetical protein VIM42_09220 [Clostridium sp.]
MTNCWFCGAPMVWCGDSTYEDLLLEGEGIVATLNCTNCNASADFYSNEDEE